MTTKTYEARAERFARLLVALFAGCVTLSDFMDALEYYNANHTRKLTYAHGVSRIAIMRADYVIKFDIKPLGVWSNGRAGNIDSEAQVYARAVEAGMAHLLAKTTVCEYDGRKFAIMPRIKHVNDYERWWGDYCTREEERWLDRNVGDLHEGNLGYRNGKVCVIDYAWDDSDEEIWR